MKNSVYCYLLFFLMMISSSLNAQQKDYKYSKSNITQEFLDVTLKERLYKNLQQNTPSTINEHDLSHYYFDNYAQYKQQFVQIAANVKQETKQVFLDVLNQLTNQIILDFQLLPANYFQSHQHSLSTSNQKKGEPNDKGAGDPCNNADFETCDFTGWTCLMEA